MQVSGHTAVVTGAGSGIGLALARLLAAGDARVIMADRNATVLGEAADLGAIGVVADVSRPEDCEALAELAPAARIVCLNAGVLSSHGGPVWLTPPDEWDRVVAINLGGVINGLRAFVPRMVADGQPHQIIITASLAGVATWPGGGAYAASKHAVVTVAEQTALDLADTRVTVTLLCPALVRSAMSPEGADPGDVATAVLDASDRGVFAVIPPEWAQAVRDRSRRLSVGLPPQLPVAS